ncbi:MAG: hypothetical protein A2Y88_02130 [Chloroflexi bacterium RBG_13_48_10]|nr:MAG: hypothetical protein A2Y88_02130 [Chloroflexi bacterium RBG_13_48_10]
MVKTMQVYDLGVAWNWEYDADFIALLDAGCRSKGLSMLAITSDRLAEVLNALAEKEIFCRAFFDRASDVDPQFMPLIQWMHENRIYGINSYERASLTWDKAKMHSLLVTAGLDVPHTIILPAYFDQPDLPDMDLFILGEQFTIKPAHGSGGVGVVINATSWDQVVNVRREHASDKYLLQAHIVPKSLDLRPAWFRVIYCTGQIYPCWWNPESHVYTPVTPEEKSYYGLGRLEDNVAIISRLSGLDLFSSEIALTNNDQYIVVDYVNDQIDLRLQSSAFEGVPDVIVRDIAERLVSQLVNRG